MKLPRTLGETTRRMNDVGFVWRDQKTTCDANECHPYHMTVLGNAIVKIVLWATSRVPVDGAAIASDVR
ncbi:hypothetical protein AVEN_177888-1, partial [Araneus ventricosus]